MPEYLVSFKASAEKELFHLPDSVIARVFPRIEALSADPRPHGCKKLRGASSLWCVRVGDYRVVYLIDDNARRIEVTRIAHRREVYET